MTDPRILALRDRGALFVVNHSGGKDSQAMTLRVRALVPAAQIVLVHAVLPESDWDGIEDHIRATTRLPDGSSLPFYTTVARWADGRVKTFLDMVEDRGFWPSPSCRQCTSDLKRTPLEVVIRRLARERGSLLIVNCDGRRAEESPDRAKLSPFGRNNRLSKAGREVYDWLPIHDWTVGDVFGAIAEAGQEPHWAYGEGMSRLSCCFCIMASKADLVTAARLKPALFARYVAMEQRIGQTFLMPKKNGQRLFLDALIAQATLPELKAA